MAPTMPSTTLLVSPMPPPLTITLASQPAMPPTMIQTISA